LTVTLCCPLRHTPQAVRRPADKPCLSPTEFQIRAVGPEFAEAADGSDTHRYLISFGSGIQSIGVSNASKNLCESRVSRVAVLYVDFVCGL
jgi:hypothetical protein